MGTEQRGWGDLWKSVCQPRVMKTKPFDIFERQVAEPAREG